MVLIALKVLLVAAIAGYLGVVLLVWLAQDRMLFFPQPPGKPATAPEGWLLEQVSFDTRDGTRLSGVLAVPPISRPPLLIYYGGNAEEVTAYAASVAGDYGNRAVLLVNYRGPTRTGSSTAARRR